MKYEEFGGLQARAALVLKSAGDGVLGNRAYVCLDKVKEGNTEYAGVFQVHKVGDGCGKRGVILDQSAGL